MSDAVNLALFVARLWVGLVMFAHGYRHVKAVRSGPGMAKWLGSLGLKYPALQAQLLTWSEVAVAPVLAAGLLTPAAYGVVISLMLVAFVTNHWDKGFFITARPTEGYEYVATLAVLSGSLATFGPGEWSLDNAFDLTFPFKPREALLAALIVGVGGTVGYLATFWRPPKKSSGTA
jgi:putative oxidoreductase